MTLKPPQYPADVFDPPRADEAEQRSQVLSNLLRVSTYLVSVLDPAALIESLAQRVVEVVPAVQAGLLWIFDRQHNLLRVESLHGLDLGPGHAALLRTRLRPGEGLPGTVLQRGEPLLIETRANYRDLAGRVSPRSEEDLRLFLDRLPRELSAVVLPLRIGPETIGVLELMNLGHRPPLRREDLQVLQTFSNLAAGAIKNAQLHAQMQAHQRRLEAFGAIGTAVSTAADVDELMSNVLDVILGVVAAPGGTLLLLDPGRAVLDIGAQRALPPAYLAAFAEQPVAGAACEEAVRYGQPVRRPLIAEAGEELLIEAGFAACAHVPLLAGGTVVGIVSIYGDQLLPDRLDVQALMMMSSLIGFAIANVRLYNESQTERRKLAALINSIAEGVVLCDQHGRLVLANQSAMELLSIERLPFQQTISEMADFYAIRDVDDLPLPVERLPLARALSGEVFHDYRVLSRGASGEDTVLSFSGAPVYDDEGAVEGAVVIFRDVTTSQKLERAKDDFLAVAAHELRSPLAAVRGYADLLLRRSAKREEDPAELRGLTILGQQVTHMLRLVDNLLDVSRLDADQLSLAPQQVNLVALAQQVIEQQRPAAGERDLVLDCAESELVVSCDALRIRQVLTNLVGNAIRYSPNGTTVAVRIRADRSDRVAQRHPAFAAALRNVHWPEPAPLALVQVQDQGGGIPEDQTPRLFRRYSRGAKRAGEGLGLSLYLSKEFITRHGGEIWVESCEGQGSTFLFTLPLDAEHTNGVEHR